jgi:hypothetical protein
VFLVVIVGFGFDCGLKGLVSQSLNKNNKKVGKHTTLDGDTTVDASQQGGKDRAFSIFLKIARTIMNEFGVLPDDGVSKMNQSN